MTARSNNEEETHALQQTRLLNDLGQRGASVSAGAGDAPAQSKTQPIKSGLELYGSTETGFVTCARARLFCDPHTMASG